MIDVHAHVFGARDWVPEWFWQHYVSVLSRNLGRPAEAALASLWDPTGDKLIAAMRTGTDLKITVQDANKKPIEMSLPLLGFGVAFDKAK